MTYENELYHHGIFGMKWGKKNGPPYPLKPSKHSASEKKAGWRKSLFNKKVDQGEEQKVIIPKKDYKHPDSKYFDSRKFGSQDLRNLTDRFNNEKQFNDALAAKLRSENMLNEDILRNMNKKQKKELYQRISEMDLETAYNRAIQQNIQAQVDLIRSQQTLAQLNAKPPTKGQKARAAVGNMLKDIGKRTVSNVGTDVSTYLIGTGINKLTGAEVVNMGKYKKNKGNPHQKEINDLNWDTEYRKAQFDNDNAKKGIFNNNQKKNNQKKGNKP